MEPLVSDVVPLSDQAALARCADEAAALALAGAAGRAGWPWLVEVVPAYTTVAVFFDPGAVTFDAAAACVRALASGLNRAAAPAGRRHEIPCCYERGPDLRRVAEHTGLPVEEVVRRHAGTEYTVYAIGFCPGFPYLGYLPSELAGVPRLPTPRLKVPAGSVGLTGRQTGVYTLDRPGGWNLVGQTPLVLVDVAAGYFPLWAGDRVRFVPVGEGEFRRRQGERLSGSRVAAGSVSGYQ